MTARLVGAGVALFCVALVTADMFPTWALAIGAALAGVIGVATIVALVALELRRLRDVEMGREA